MAGAAAIFVLAGMVAFLPGVLRTRVSPPVTAALRPATPAEARAALARAALALRERDRAAFLSALPCSGAPARRAVRELYKRLAPLPWSSFFFAISRVRGTPGRYEVRAAGELGRAGPADRVAALRVLDLEVSHGSLVVTGDATPSQARSQYLMAFYDPVVVQRNGLVLVADRPDRPRAEALANAAPAADARLAILGLTPKQPVVVSVFSSMEELQASLGDSLQETRMRFFSYSSARLSRQPWRDVGVLGPDLSGLGSWMTRMLAHELTHEYTWRWFVRTRHAPTFLLEGLAMAVEGDHDNAALRQEVATGDQIWPLVGALRTDDLWKGSTSQQVNLVYVEAGSVIDYVLKRWGLARVKPFVTAVADSDLKKDGLDEATRQSLGVSWTKFYSGWRRYVLALP